MRTYWKVKKAEERANMTSQRKCRLTEQHREKYAYFKKKRISESTAFLEEILDKGYTNEEARMKAVYRADQCMPNSPNKFADVIAGLASKATPRKRKAMDKEGLFLTPSKRARLDFFNKSFEKVQKELQDTKKTWDFVHKCSQMQGLWEDEQKTRSEALDRQT